ncbi:MAG: hypothetical protein IH991_22970, partial [Planctomycetes bacterium]|nr:hypothetical protein [Planctomycetota bacterium]
MHRSNSAALNRVCLAALVLVTLVATTLSAADGYPEGWTTAAPRDEIKPNFAYSPNAGRDGKGGFIIEHDEREGLD